MEYGSAKTASSYDIRRSIQSYCYSECLHTLEILMNKLKTGDTKIIADACNLLKKQLTNMKQSFSNKKNISMRSVILY